MKVKNQRRGGVIIGYANIIVKNVVNLLYTPMLLSFVGKGDFGVFQTSNSFIFSLTLLSFGFSGAYVRFYTKIEAENEKSKIEILNGIYLILYSIICILIIIIGLLISGNVELFFAKSFSKEEIELASKLMAIMSINIALTLFSTVFDANIIVHERFVFQQTRQMLTTMATPVLALTLLFCGLQTIGVALAQLVISLILLALNAHFAISRLGMRFNFRSFDISLLRSIAAFSTWLFANQVCDLINQNVPNIILGAECGTSIVAVFAVSIQIRHVFISLSTTISNVFVPEVNRVVADSNDNSKLNSIVANVGRYQMLLLCWVYGGFAVLGKFFINKWAGEEFSDAYWIILAMVLPLIIPLSQNIGIEIQRAKNMHKTRSIVYFVMAIISVIFTVLFANLLGYWAAAFAYIISIVLGNCLFMNWYYHNRVGLDMLHYWKSVLPIITCSIVSTLLCICFESIVSVNNWMTFFAWGLIYSIVYIVFHWFFSIHSSERELFKNALLRIVNRE